MPGKKDRLVILPAHNESRFIEEIITKVRSYSDAHILLVDDGSTDDTAYKARLAGVDFIIANPENAGYGRSLARGFEFALDENYASAVTMDCDAQHEPEMIETFFTRLKNADIVSGSRYMNSSEKKTGVPVHRYRINRIITEKINRITGYNLTDAFCGFKGYRSSALEEFNITENGYGMPLQLWIQASGASLKVKEVPVALIYHTRESFPRELASPPRRLEYYMKVIENETEKK